MIHFNVTINNSEYYFNQMLLVIKFYFLGGNLWCHFKKWFNSYFLRHHWLVFFCNCLTEEIAFSLEFLFFLFSTQYINKNDGSLNCAWVLLNVHFFAINKVFGYPNCTLNSSKWRRKWIKKQFSVNHLSAKNTTVKKITISAHLNFDISLAFVLSHKTQIH